MAIGDDFSVAANGDIRHTSGSATYRVLDLHRWLQDLADDAAASGNDLIDITSSTPSERSTDNIITLNSPFNIDDTAAQFLYDGSISQAGGDTLYSGLVVVGSVNLSTTLQVVQNGGLYDGDAPFWGAGINAVAADNILTRMLIKTRNTGSDIDGKRIRIYARELGDTYAEFSLTMGLGNSVAAIFTNADLNNETAEGTIAGWSTIANVEGYQTIDLNNGSGARPYYSQWDRAAYTINQLYERTKWLTRRGSTSVLYGMDGELFRGITHQWNYNTESGNFSELEGLSWGTGATSGSGILLALDDQGTTGTMWIQLVTGVAPTDTMQITGSTSLETCNVNGAPTSRTLPTHILGVSTGTAVIGAFGVGIQSADLTVADKLFDLTNAQQQPPNNVNFTVTNLVDSEDRVLVGPKDTGNAFKFDQFALQNTLSGASETTIAVSPAIPSDTPSPSGTIRVQLDTGVYRRIAYTSWTSGSFTIAGTDFQGALQATAGNNVFISYIDDIAGVAEELSFTAVYNVDRNLFVRVRDGGGSPIKTFETPAVLGSAGGSVAAIRTSDA